MSRLILGLSASLNNGAVVLIKGSEVLAAEEIGPRGTHSRKIVKVATELLDKYGYSLGDVDLYGVDRGPGSFTGIRLALSATRCLAWMSEKPVIVANSLEVLAQNAHTMVDELSDEFVVTLDARRGAVYCAKFCNDVGLSALSEPQLVATSNVATDLSKNSVLFGSPLALYAERFPGMKVVPKDIFYNPKCFAARLIQHSDDEEQSWETVVPLYLRRPEAEEVWENRQKLRDANESEKST